MGLVYSYKSDTGTATTYPQEFNSSAVISSEQKSEFAHRTQRARAIMRHVQERSEWVGPPLTFRGLLGRVRLIVIRGMEAARNSENNS